MAKIEKEFKQPEPRYRSTPFWSWNDELHDRDLQDQLDEMKKGGMTGGFMHSRTGLTTPIIYLYGLWFGTKDIFACLGSRDWIKYSDSVMVMT